MKPKHHSTRLPISRRSQLNRRYSQCRVYVIELSPDACSHPGFLLSNPHHIPGQPCYYVGMTSLTPAERFLNHRRGLCTASDIVKLHGRRLRPDLMIDLPIYPRSRALSLERQVARDLRQRGMGVWQY